MELVNTSAMAGLFGKLALFVSEGRSPAMPVKTSRVIPFEGCAPARRMSRVETTAINKVRAVVGCQDIVIPPNVTFVCRENQNNFSARRLDNDPPDLASVNGTETRASFRSQNLKCAHPTMNC